MEIMQIEDKIMAIAKRFFEVKKEVHKQLKELEIIRDVAGFSVVEEGNMDEPTVYAHNLHKGIIFYDEDMEGCNVRPFKKCKGQIEGFSRNDKEINNNAELNKLAKFLNAYSKCAERIWSDIFIDDKDYLVGEYISASEIQEVDLSIDVEHYYRLSIPLWVKRIEEISVYYLLKEPRYEKEFWKNYKEKVEQKKRIDARLKELDKPVGKKKDTTKRWNE